MCLLFRFHWSSVYVHYFCSQFTLLSLLTLSGCLRSRPPLNIRLISRHVVRTITYSLCLHNVNRTHSLLVTSCSGNVKDQFILFKCFRLTRPQSIESVSFQKQYLKELYLHMAIQWILFAYINIIEGSLYSKWLVVSCYIWPRVVAQDRQMQLSSLEYLQNNNLVNQYHRYKLMVYLK